MLESYNKTGQEASFSSGWTMKFLKDLHTRVRDNLVIFHETAPVSLGLQNVWFQFPDGPLEIKVYVHRVQAGPR